MGPGGREPCRRERIGRCRAGVRVGDLGLRRNATHCPQGKRFGADRRGWATRAPPRGTRRSGRWRGSDSERGTWSGSRALVRPSCDRCLLLRSWGQTTGLPTDHCRRCVVNSCQTRWHSAFASEGRRARFLWRARNRRFGPARSLSEGLPDLDRRRRCAWPTLTNHGSVVPAGRHRPGPRCRGAQAFLSVTCICLDQPAQPVDLSRQIGGRAAIGVGHGGEMCRVPFHRCERRCHLLGSDDLV